MKNQAMKLILGLLIASAASAAYAFPRDNEFAGRIPAGSVLTVGWNIKFRSNAEKTKIGANDDGDRWCELRHERLSKARILSSGTELLVDKISAHEIKLSTASGELLSLECFKEDYVDIHSSRTEIVPIVFSNLRIADLKALIDPHLVF